MMKFITPLIVIASFVSGCATTTPTCQNTHVNQRLIYPDDSRRLEEEGKVTLKVFVSHLGYPTEISLHQSSGFSNLDESAMAAIKTWCFSPAISSGKAVDAWALVPIVYRLEDK